MGKFSEIKKTKVLKSKGVTSNNERLSLEDIDNCIERIYKIEKLILENGFNTENAKRFIVSSKSLLQL